MNFSKVDQMCRDTKSGLGKMTLQFLVIVLVLNGAALFAQEQAYVIADNGLTIRDKPDVSSEKLGKLNYGDEIEITEKTKIKMVIIDEGKKVAGEWVKVKTPSKAGYVFNGYLAKEKQAGHIEFLHSGLEIKIKNLASTDEFKVHSFFDESTVNVSVELGDSPEGKTLIIDNKKYKRISVFQRFQNSLSLMNEGPICDVSGWEQYDSLWRPIAQKNATTFETLVYTETDRSTFGPVSIDALKAYVKDNCGADWAKYMEDAKTLKDYPVHIDTHRIFIKFLLTDFEDKVTEKIIEFEIPSGC